MLKKIIWKDQILIPHPSPTGSQIENSPVCPGAFTVVSKSEGLGYDQFSAAWIAEKLFVASVVMNVFHQKQGQGESTALQDSAEFTPELDSRVCVRHERVNVWVL